MSPYIYEVISQLTNQSQAIENLKLFNEYYANGGNVYRNIDPYKLKEKSKTKKFK